MTERGKSPINESWQASVLTLYPEMFPGSLGLSLAGNALERGIWGLEALDIRNFSSHKHRSVDDTPSGGGPGMVLRPDVVATALDAACSAKDGQSDARPAIYLSPRGKPLTQKRVADLASGPGVVLLCGRFEGIDERVIEARALEEVSLGDFVLSGGEPAAIALLDACVRLLPGVMGAEASGTEESFESGLLEYPHYTRPQTWEGRDIPEVLTSGHHGNVATWRKQKAEEITRERRPDLWSTYQRDQQKDQSNESD